MPDAVFFGNYIFIQHQIGFWRWNGPNGEFAQAGEYVRFYNCEEDEPDYEPKDEAYSVSTQILPGPYLWVEVWLSLKEQCT